MFLYIVLNNKTHIKIIGKSITLWVILSKKVLLYFNIFIKILNFGEKLWIKRQ